MQRAKATYVFSRDLQQTISDVKKDGYRKALGEAKDLVTLDRIQHRVRLDFQLTRVDRLQLLAEVDLALTSFDHARADK